MPCTREGRYGCCSTGTVSRAIHSPGTGEAAPNRCLICLETGDGTCAPGSVKISVSRVGIGKKDKGDESSGENITAR